MIRKLWRLLVGEPARPNIRKLISECYPVGWSHGVFHVGPAGSGANGGRQIEYSGDIVAEMWMTEQLSPKTMAETKIL